MENSVTAAPLLVRKGITYTKLAVTQTGVGEERRGAVLHLGTGEGNKGSKQGKTRETRTYNTHAGESEKPLKEDKMCLVLFTVADRGELHRVAVVGQNATLLQEIPLFTSQEPVNNIMLHQVNNMPFFIHTNTCCTNAHTHSAYKYITPCLQGQALVGSPMSLARVQAEGCALYPSCEVCARARGLGCMWSTKEDACRPTTAE